MIKPYFSSRLRKVAGRPGYRLQAARFDGKVIDRYYMTRRGAMIARGRYEAAAKRDFSKLPAGAWFFDTSILLNQMED